MDQKPSTDIDRKLAIYYHPLFQEVIKGILDLFHIKQEKFEVGLLEFVEFNLKLQKALLPSFELDNALVSGFNDWVKEVAECLTYEGMVSTAGCVQVTPANLQQLLLKEYESVAIELFQKKDKYLQALLKISNHDAFKLLGVKINKEVFSKFMFDLCSTWCEFLDVELFSYFLIGLYIQISQGQTINGSKFKETSSITTIDLQFMEQFEEIKSTYNRVKKKQLRYYRAWCEWNYLRVNQIGQRLILKLDQLNPQDHRILQLALIFEKSIQVINQEITSQNPPTQIEEKVPEKQKQEVKDFLTWKGINIQKTSGLSGKKEEKQPEDTYQQFQYPETNQDVIPQDFQIEIDDMGNMYLKRIVKLPIIGIKIQPQVFNKKIIAKREIGEKNANKFRAVSNLYGRMENMKIRLEHNTKNDHYAYKKSPKIQERDKFYEQAQKKNEQMQKTIHDKMIPKEAKKLQDKPQIPQIFKEQKVSLRQMKEYEHKVMAPVFMTDNQNNISYSQNKQGQIYSNNAIAQKRQLKIGMPKPKNIDFRVKQLKSYHVVGKLTTDRSLINDKVKSFSLNKESPSSKLEKLKQENHHIWSRYIDEEQIQELTNYGQFYKKLQQAKMKFGRQFQSQFRTNLKPLLAYENRRYEMGGILGKQDQERFSERIKRLINKENRKQNKKKRKQKLKQYRKNFKNKQQKSLFEDIFISYHRQAIKEIKEERERQRHMINY